MVVLRRRQVVLRHGQIVLRHGKIVLRHGHVVHLHGPFSFKKISLVGGVSSNGTSRSKNMKKIPKRQMTDEDKKKIAELMKRLRG